VAVVVFLDPTWVVIEFDWVGWVSRNEMRFANDSLLVFEPLPESRIRRLKSVAQKN